MQQNRTKTPALPNSPQLGQTICSSTVEVLGPQLLLQLDLGEKLVLLQHPAHLINKRFLIQHATERQPISTVDSIGDFDRPAHNRDMVFQQFSKEACGKELSKKCRRELTYLFPPRSKALFLCGLLVLWSQLAPMLGRNAAPHHAALCETLPWQYLCD